MKNKITTNNTVTMKTTTYKVDGAQDQYFVEEEHYQGQDHIIKKIKTKTFKNKKKISISTKSKNRKNIGWNIWSFDKTRTLERAVLQEKRMKALRILKTIVFLSLAVQKTILFLSIQGPDKKQEPLLALFDSGSTLESVRQRLPV